MQTETTHRLLRLDGEKPSGYRIVAEVLYCTTERVKELGLNIHWDAKPQSFGIERFWRKPGGTWWGCYPLSSPKHDAFELGIKLPDGTWWFEGDIIEFEHNDWAAVCSDNVKRVIATGIIEFNLMQYSGWGIKKLGGQNWSFYHPEGRNFSWEELKCVGNIHKG